MKRLRPATLVAIFVTSVIVVWMTFGGMMLGIVLPVWLLIFAWRFDNHTGSLLLPAILLLIVMAIMVALIGLMALRP